MIPVKVFARGDGSTAELVDATLTFDDVIGSSGRRQRDGFVGVKVSADAAAVKAAIKIDLEVARIRTTAASAILESITLARASQLDLAHQRLENAMAIVRAASTRLKDPELAKIVSQLEEVAAQLAQLVPPQQQIVGDKPGSDAIDSQVPAMAPPTIEVKLRRTQEAATKAVTGR